MNVSCLFSCNSMMRSFYHSLLSLSSTEFFRLCSEMGIFYSSFKVHFIIWPPPLSLLIANDKIIVIYWMHYYLFYCLFFYCLPTKSVVKTIFTALKNWNELIFRELKPEVTIFSAAEFSLKFTKDLCLHWFIIALGKTTHSV